MKRHKSQTKNLLQEPDIQTAFGWWQDLPDIFTPVAWKNHLFHFNVFFNGILYAEPHLYFNPILDNERTKQWEGRGVQLTLMPFTPFTSFDNVFDLREVSYLWRDDGMVKQGWYDYPAPVLWTEWVADGILLRQEVFAHIPGGKDITTGIEPHFAWIRLSVHYVCPAIPIEEKHGFLIKINAPHMSAGMSNRYNIFFHPEKSAYPRKIYPETTDYDGSNGFRLLEEDGKVRLGIAPGRKCHIEFAPNKPTEKDNYFYVQMDAKQGNFVDLLLPMIPTEREVFDGELSLGRDRALAEANKYWERIPETSAVFETPEDFINQTVKHSLKFSEVIAERNPGDGNYSIISGTFVYAKLWATPGSMTLSMLMDMMGHHSIVERYLEIFKKTQGTVKPPSDSIEKHQGYLATPKTLTGIDWLSDHGALLWAISEHCLLGGDLRITDGWVETIIRACEFIKYARSIKGHGGVERILPPAIATDRRKPIQAIWSDGWNFKGLTSAVKVLKAINHPRAKEYENEVNDYKNTFQKILKGKCRRMPIWTDSRGRKRAFVPTDMSDSKSDNTENASELDDGALFRIATGFDETRHAFYLDTGPLFLVFAGLMDVDDPLMKSSLLWFREGPPVKMSRYDSACWQMPSLQREMSSCEPCYSWNIFHSHKTGDRIKYLEGMYSLFAGSVSRKTYISCETRGGITANLISAPVAIYLARLAVIDDLFREDELHLLRIMPCAWLKKNGCRLENMPTYFGPVGLKVKLTDNGRTLQVFFKPNFRIIPKKIILHIPPVRGLKKILLNGKRLKGMKKSYRIKYGMI